jgi:hypothetical protein
MSQLRDDFMRLATSGVPSSEDIAFRLSVALDKFIGFWSAETLPFVAAGGSELRFLEAPYGRGKTHLLLLMARAARRAGFATALVQCSPESKPFASVERTYRAIIPSLQFAGRNGSDHYNLFQFLGTCTPRQLSDLQETDRINPGYRNLLWAYGHRSRSENSPRSLTAALSNLIRALPETPVRVPELYRQDYRLPRPLGKLNKRTAMPWLRGLLQIPQAMGLKGLVLLFDETGADFHLGRESLSVKRAHFAHLRNLIDHLGVGRLPGCAITYAVATDLIHEARETLLPLAQRVERILPDDPNPRAIWCFLDELTSPPTTAPEFYAQLGHRVVEIGREAGFGESTLRQAANLIPALAKQKAESINNAAVREFIKHIASTIAG